MAASPVAAQPNLGHKMPGVVGSGAGIQTEEGVYVADRFVYYDAIRLRGRDGERIVAPGFDIDAYANAVGLAATMKLRGKLLGSAAVAVPFTRIVASTDEPRAALDRFGLGDVFVKPIQLGTRWTHFDLFGSYGFYVPTRQFNREGLAAPQWAHQLSLGSTAYFDEHRRWRISALLSYELHQKKQGIDVTRGDSVQIQGGLGGAPSKWIELGLAAYALWQVRDDRGSDLPSALRGRRDRVFGLGPELAVPIPPLSAKVGLRYTRDFGVQGRPEGQLVVVGVALRLGSPPPADTSKSSSEGRESNGSSMVNVVPASGSLCTSTRPPCAWATARTSVSPKPQPSVLPTFGSRE